MTALLPLRCPYCGGGLAPVLAAVHVGGQRVETECDDCGAQWTAGGGAMSGPVQVEARRMHVADQCPCRDKEEPN